MTEATDRPQGAGEGITARPEGGAVIGPGAAASPKTREETYRPLSLLALAAFGLGVLYVLLVVLGAVVALFNHLPWLMPLWTFLLPVAVVLMCWAARTRIRNSEGTLGGLAFTAWAFRLTVIIALLYACYYGFTFFAVSLQAKDCADRFFEQIKQGQLERAFLLAMGVSTKGTDEKELRDILEVRFNNPAGPGSATGAYARFRQSPFVRAIETSGGEVAVSPRGVVDWGYGQGGYRFVMKYYVATPLTEFEMNVETFGRDSKPGEPKGRQWQVMLQKGETGVIPSTMKPTPHGADYMRHAMAAQNFASNWIDNVNRGQWSQVSLDTFPSAEREKLRRQLPATRLLSLAPVAGLAPAAVAAANGAGEDRIDWQEAALRTLIRVDEKTFWTSKRERAAILQHVAQTFATPSDRPPTVRLQMQNTQFPLSRAADGERIFLFDATLMYMERPSDRPKYVVSANVAVAAPEDRLDGPPTIWRIQGIEVTSGRTAAPPEAGRPPGLGGR